MRTAVTLLLLFLYFTAFSGATLTVHYCMGTIASVTFDEAYKKKDCDKCNAKKKSCCEDKQTILQVSSKHEPSPELFSFSKVKYTLPKEEFSLFQTIQLSAVYLSYIDKTEENPPSVPLYISHCLYLI